MTQWLSTGLNVSLRRANRHHQRSHDTIRVGMTITRRPNSKGSTDLLTTIRGTMGMVFLTRYHKFGSCTVLVHIFTKVSTKWRTAEIIVPWMAPILLLLCPSKRPEDRERTRLFSMVVRVLCPTSPALSAKPHPTHLHHPNSVSRWEKIEKISVRSSKLLPVLRRDRPRGSHSPSSRTRQIKIRETNPRPRTDL